MDNRPSEHDVTRALTRKQRPARGQQKLLKVRSMRIAARVK